MHSDAEILAGCRAGDRHAWAVLVDRHGPAVLRALQVRMGRDRAEDLFQEFWVEIMAEKASRLSSADPDRPLAPYLVTVALHFCRRHLARERISLPLEAVAGKAGPGPDPAGSASVREELTRIHQGLEGLSARETLILRLARIEGLPHARIAEIAGVSVRSVSTLAARAVESLRREVL